MRPTSRNAFVVAAVVHVAFAALLFVMTVWKPEKKKEPVVFEMFAPPSDLPVQDGPPVAEVIPVNFEFTPPELPPPPPPKPEPKPEPPPKPEPQPKPPEPKPKPPEPKPKPPEPKPKPPEPKPVPKPKPPEPKPAPKPPPAPEPERVSFDQFRTKNPQPKPKPQPAPRPPEPINVPRIDTSAITKSLESTLSREQMAQVSRQSSTDQAALNAYFSRIKSAVRGAWAKPYGLHDTLRVTIRFDVSAGGNVTNASVSSSSGNSIFDQSVLDAFARAGSVGPSPDRRPYSLRLEFRMTD